MIKVVLIDIDNTLLDFNKCAEESVRLSFKKFGLEFNDKTFPVFKSINDGLWLDIGKKKITRQDLHDIRFNLILEALGQKFDGRLIEKEFLDNLYDIAIPCDGAIDVLKYLSKKYVIAVASNAFYEQQVNRLTLANMYEYVSKMFISERIGFSKPDRRFFDACMRDLEGAIKDEVIMIGDSITADIVGAKDFGIKTIWYNKENIDKKCEKADYTITSLYSVKEIL